MFWWRCWNTRWRANQSHAGHLVYCSSTYYIYGHNHNNLYLYYLLHLPATQQAHSLTSQFSTLHSGPVRGSGKANRWSECRQTSGLDNCALALVWYFEVFYHKWFHRESELEMNFIQSCKRNLHISREIKSQDWPLCIARNIYILLTFDSHEVNSGI